MLQDLQKRIQVLEDIEAIKRLKHQYCYLVDAAINGDAAKWDELLAHFSDDAWGDYGMLGIYKGKAAMAKFFKEFVPNELLSFSAHMVANPIIDVNGHTATGSWYVLVPCTLKSADRAMWIKARYEEEYVKVNGEWKWQSITARFDFFTPYDEGWAQTKMFSID